MREKISIVTDVDAEPRKQRIRLMLVGYGRAPLHLRKFPHSRRPLWIFQGRLGIGAMVVLVQRLPLFRPVGFIGILVHRIPVAVAAVSVREASEGGREPTVVLSHPRSIPTAGETVRAADSARSGGSVATSACGAGRSGSPEGCDRDHGDSNRFHGFHQR